jgi:hypothetical protein
MPPLAVHHPEMTISPPITATPRAMFSEPAIKVF